MIDLHTHTDYSDGTDSPAALVRSAYQAGLRIIAVTDHDITDALPEARAAAGDLRGLEVIPGIELSCEMDRYEVHVLGYFLDLANDPLQRRLAELRAARVTRADRILDKLDAIGIRLDRDRVRVIAGTGSFGRPHIARALVEVGWAASVSDAFQLYLSHGRPAYVERPKLTVPEAIDLIRAAGGSASIAHPLGLPDLPALIAMAKRAGLAGLECHYGRYSGKEVDQLVALAEAHDLVPTGGSDYHGSNKEGVNLGDADVPIGSLTRLRDRAAA
ncbi:MAG TPA: PHP domain-containing protein [Dehalococcoidia bacterium]|nr:PHP domain-containing protein [Dehalococcoidia bacterium]